MKANLVLYPNALALPDDCEAVLHRRRLLDIVFGHGLDLSHRKRMLDACCNGDIRSTQIEHYGNASPDKLARAIVFSLLPCSLRVFPRHRWLSSTESLREGSLLFNVHSIFQQALPRWLSEMAGKPKKVSDRRAGWVEDGPLVPIEARVGDADCQGNGFQWADENDKRRATLQAWAATSPGPRLLVMCIGISPQTRMLCRYFDMASSSWDVAQLKEMLKSGSRKYRFWLLLARLIKFPGPIPPSSETLLQGWILQRHIVWDLLLSTSGVA